MKIDPIRTLLPLQLGIALLGAPAIVLAPPAEGQMLLVPVWPGSGTHLAADVVARGGRLVAPGPFSGSLVVEGRRDPVAAGLWFRGVAVISATALGCGEEPRGGSR